MAYATNDPRSATEDYVARLWKIGIRASVRDVVTVGGAIQHLLAETRSGRTAFVVGTEALRRHVSDAGLRVLNGTDLASRAEVVVVGGTEDLVYDDLRIAALAVRRGADFLATARDPTYPQPDGLWPGTGAILAAVEVASGRTAEIVGKPEPQLMLTALDRLGGGRTLVVGDRVDTDLAAAAAAELDAASGAERRDGTTGTEWVRARAGGRHGHARRPDPGLLARWRSESESRIGEDRTATHPGLPSMPGSPDPNPHQRIHLRRRPPRAARTCSRSPSARPGRLRQRLRRLHPARLVQVRRAHRGHEVRVPVPVHRHRPAPPQLAAAAAAAAPRAPPPRAAPTPPARGATRARPPRTRRGCGATLIVETHSRTPCAFR